MRQLAVSAIVVSHVDYSCWASPCTRPWHRTCPWCILQSTGGAKAYAWFPEKATPGSFRAQMTLAIGDYFERFVWGNRDLLRRSAELTAHRDRHDWGRPSWWRSSGESVIHSAGERRDVRPVSAAHLGIDPSAPVVAVFAHAFSDALGSNVEVFDDFVDWLEETAALASEHCRTGANTHVADTSPVV